MGGYVENLTVIELGEDTDAWFVQGTRDVEAARGAVRNHVREQLSGASDLELLDEVLTIIGTQSAKVADDWWWQPVDPEEPDGDHYLRTASESATPTSARLLTGVWFG